MSTRDKSREVCKDRRAMADITGQLAALREMTVGQLREKYREVFSEPSRSRNKDYLRKKIAWQIQANAEGGLSPRALAKIEELGPLAPVRWRHPLGKVDLGGPPPEQPSATEAPSRDPRLPAPGATITRSFNGEEHRVLVLDKGFEYQGSRYRSLSKIAKEISGTNWNGFLFWGLTTRAQTDGGEA